MAPGQGTVRLAGAADRRSVREFVQEIRAHFGEPPGGEGLERVLDDALSGGPLEFFLALDGEVPVGLVSITCAPTSQGDGLFAWLDDLHVRQAHRRRGLGTLLIESAVARARARGAGEVRLAAPMGDAGVVALYRGAGFSARGQALMALSLDADGRPEGP